MYFTTDKTVLSQIILMAGNSCKNLNQCSSHPHVIILGLGQFVIIGGGVAVVFDGDTAKQSLQS